MNKEERIFNKISSDLKHLNELGLTVVGIFLQGSQNYELDYDKSDVDTKAIVLPTFKDFLLNKKPISTTYENPETKEHLDIKDIRLMFDCFKKQNINFLEILFTKYYWLNPDFENEYLPLMKDAELIAHYNNYAAINCIAGMVFEKRKALTHEYEGLKDIIQKFGFDRKQLHHILRCEEFLNRFMNGVSYKDCLISKQPDYLKEVKSNENMFTCEQAVKLADEVVERVRSKKDNYFNTVQLKVNEKAQDLLDLVLYNICKKSFKNEILN